jgi:neutral ceramidase
MGMFRAGAATRDITPNFAVSMHGYGNRTHRSTAAATATDIAACSSPAHEPLTVGCLALEDAEGTQLLIVTCDMIGIEATKTQELYKLLFDEVGVGFPHVLISCSHTHFAPGLHPAETEQDSEESKPEPAFVADFRAKLIEAARESLRSLRPAVLESTRRTVSGASFNRRWRRPDGSVVMHLRYPTEDVRVGSGRELIEQPSDGGLSILRFRGTENGQLIGCLANFGCHPVTGGKTEDDHYRLSADWPHYFRTTLTSAWSCPVFFTLGAAGDAVPILRKGDSRERVGVSLALAAALAERTFTTEREPTLAAAAGDHTAQVVDTHTWRPAYVGSGRPDGGCSFNIRPQLIRIGTCCSVALG